MDEKLLAGFQAYLDGNYNSKVTRENYYSAVRRFLEWCDYTRNKVEGKTVALYLNALTENNVQPSSAAFYYHALAAFFKHRDGSTIKQYAQRFSGYKYKETECVTNEEFHKIMAISLDAREEAIMMLLYSTAIRRSEILGLQVEDVMVLDLKVPDSKGNVVLRATPVLRVLRSKKRTGELYDYLPLEEAAYNAITHYLGMFGYTKGTVFPFGRETLYRIVKDVCGRAGVAYKGVHAFRHGRADYLLNKVGTPVPVVQKQLGHNSVASTLRYSHTTTQDLLMQVPAVMPQVNADERRKQVKNDGAKRSSKAAGRDRVRKGPGGSGGTTQGGGSGEAPKEEKVEEKAIGSTRRRKARPEEARTEEEGEADPGPSPTTSEVPRITADTQRASAGTWSKQT